jgi:hypothetical protein
MPWHLRDELGRDPTGEREVLAYELVLIDMGVTRDA